MKDVRSPPGMPQPGELIAGKYRIEKVIGAGGMGCVLAAQHVLLRTRVAVKLLLPEATALAGGTERFFREAQAAAALRGEHVARVLDMGLTESGAPFLVMEHLSGMDLRQVIRERAPLPIEEAVGYLLQACEALGEAHAMGIFHRDLKPANLFVTSRPNGSPLLKVLDFGLAKVVAPAGSDSAEEMITQTGQVIGSPQYMPPEQFRSLRNADARSDIWALGVVLYELFTGKRPFVGEGMAGVMASVITDDPAPATSLRPDLPPALNALVMRCLEKRPERRPQRVGDLIAVLEIFAPKPERASLAWIDHPAAEAEPATTPVQRRSSPEPAPAAVPDPVAVPVYASNPLKPDPQPSLMPPLPGRSTVRIAAPTRSSAADELTGAVVVDAPSFIAAGPVPIAPPGSAPTPAPAPALWPRIAATTAPADAFSRTSISNGEEAVAHTAADVTDLSQASTMARRRPGPATGTFNWTLVGGGVGLLIAGAVGARVWLSSSADKPAAEQGTVPATNAASTTQHPLAPASTPPAEPPAVTPISVAPQTVISGFPAPSVALGAPPAASPKTPGSAAPVSPGAAASATQGPAKSPSAAPVPSSAVNPRPSAKNPAAPPAKSTGGNDDPFGSKYK